MPTRPGLGHEVELEILEALGFTAATFAGCVLLHAAFCEYRAALPRELRETHQAEATPP